MAREDVGQMMEAPEGVDPIDWLEQLDGGAPADQAPSSAAPQEPEGATTPPPADGSEGEGAAPEAPQDPGQDAWFVPGQFRTPDDVLNSYRHIEQERGRLGNELGQTRAERDQLRAQLAAFHNGQSPMLPQQAQPNGVSLPAYDHPAHGYTEEQIEQLKYDDPMRLADYVSQLHVGQLLGQLAPALAPLMDSVNKQEARATIDLLRHQYGDEVVQRNSETLAAAIQRDQGFFVDEDTRHERLSTVLRAAEFDRMMQERTPQPRTPQGQYAPRDPGVHVEGGSTGHSSAPAPSQPDVPHEVAEMRQVDADRDRFGYRPRVRG